ncbi:MAG: GHKL domain-containing protein [Puniceicoccaceae bacterium]|nr:MAG: GHKL domain-containing protein [Puniceicoccaceae bacterium]
MNLEDHPFFGNLSAEQKARLAKDVEEITFAPEEVIFEENSPSDAIYLILSGSVAFCKKREDEQPEQVVSSSLAGSYFGEIGILTQERRSLTARAEGKTRVARVPAPLVESLLTRANDPLGNILSSVIRHLQSTTHHYITEIEKQEKLALVGMMMSSVLHDFRNPFSLINMATHLIRKKAANPDDITRFCNTIDVQLDRMTSMMNDIIAFSKGGETLDMRQLTLSGFSRALEESCAHLFKKEGVMIHFNFEEGEFDGDLNKLIRALQNLLSNAVEAILQTKQPGSIELSGCVDGEEVLFVLSDTGPGIPEAIIDRFFEPFVTFRKQGGTGLGSAITKSIIEAHEGKISFNSSPETGTTFRIRLPLQQTSDRPVLLYEA